MKSLRGRFIVSHLLPVLLVVPLAALALLLTVETQVLLVDVAGDLEERANFVAGIMENQPEVWSQPSQAERLLEELSRFVEGSVFLLTADGRLLAMTSEFQSPSVPAEGELIANANAETTTTIRYGWLDHEAQVVLPVYSLEEELLGTVAVSETVYGAASAFGMLRTMVLGMVLIELVIAFVAAIVLAGRLATPIERAARGVVDIAVGKPFAPQTPAGPTEIRALSQAVNTLAERLRLLEEGRRRSLANIVHEIGRPLGAILSAIHVLRQGAGDDAEIREELLAGISEEIERMMPLLDDLAQLHGQVEGQIVLRKQPIGVSAWLGSVLLPWRAAAREKGLQWQTEIAPDLPELELDPDRMAQVMGNLLSNAVKYTPAPGKVSVAAQLEGNEIMILVADSGPGIELEEQAHVFEPFYRSGRDRRFPQGLGLGLTIAHDLVTAHGGRLTLESDGESGSLFTVYLPTQAPNPNAIQSRSVT